MKNLAKRHALVWASLLLLAALVAGPAGAESEHTDDHKREQKNEQKDDELQLVSDQENVRGGDSTRFHILYHNKTGKLVAKCRLKVTVPAGLSLENEDGLAWDQAGRTATWTLNDVEAGGARVLHFKLKVDAAAKLGTKLPVAVASDSDGQVSAQAVNVPLQVAEQVYQPLFIGFPDGKFHPGGSLTRAEAAAVVARVKQLPAAGPGTPTYSDVPASHWAYGYIARVTASGHMAGSGARFNPDAPLSRADLVVLLLRLRGVQSLPFQPYADTAQHTAVNDISTAYQLEWIDGTQPGQFMPDAPTDRQTSAKLLTVALYRRPLKDGDEKVIQHFPDVTKDAWAFGWVEGVAMTAHQSKTDGQYEYLIRYLPEQTQPL